MIKKSDNATTISSNNGSKMFANVKSGDHFCFLFSSDKEHETAIGQFFRQGLELGEKVLYLYDKYQPDTLLKYLHVEAGSQGGDLLLGQLRMLPSDEVFIPEGVFEPDQTLAFIRNEISEARYSGYSGLRIGAEMTWALKNKRGSDRLIEYENSLNLFQKDDPCLICCLYDRNVFPPALLLDVLESHSQFMLENEIYPNRYYGSSKVLARSDREQTLLNNWLEYLVANRKISERMQKIKAEEEQIEMVAALRDSAAALNSTLKIDEVLDRILINLVRVVPHDAANIMLIEGNTARVERVRGYRDYVDDQAVLALRFNILELPNLKSMLKTGKPALIPDTWSDKSWVVHPDTIWVRSYAGAPIQAKGKIVGFINLDSATPGFFTPFHIERLQAFADQAALAVENARLFNSLQLQAEEMAALYRASTPLINPVRDIRILAEQIAKAINEEFTASHCGILLVDEDANKLKLLAQSGYCHQYVPELPLDGKGLTVAAFRSRQFVYCPDVSLDPLFIRGAEETRSELDIPMQVGDHVLGVINLESSRLDAFDERVRRIIANYADRAALAFQNAILFSAVKKHDEQMALMNEITQASLSAADLQTMMMEFIPKIESLTQADCCVIVLWDYSRHQAVPFLGDKPYKKQMLDLLANSAYANLINQGIHVETTIILDRESPDITNSFERLKQMPFEIVVWAPLSVLDRRLGALLLGFIQYRKLSQEEISLTEQAAGQIALAIARVQSLDFARRRAQEAENLRGAVAALASSLDLKKVLENILDYLEKVISFDSACIFLKEDEELRVVASKGLPESGETVFDSDDVLIREVWDTGLPLILKDAQADPRFRSWGGTDYIRGWMCIPFIGRMGFFGALTIDSRQPGAYGVEEAALAMTFANHAVIAVENARLYKEEQQRARELEALHSATAMLVSTLDLDILLERILTAAVMAIPAAKKGSLWLLDEATNELHVRATYGYEDIRVCNPVLSIGQSYVGRAIEERKPLLIDNVCSNKAVRYAGVVEEAGNINSAIVAPLMIENRPLGVISLDSPHSKAFTEADLRLLISFGSTVTAVIGNAQLHASVQELAITDPLTNLYNRRGFFELGQREINRSNRTENELSVVLIDTDLLKKVNDTYGHSVGDQVLVSIAGHFRANLRTTDIACRYGGDEFAILLPDTSVQTAIEVVDRLRCCISNTVIETTNGPLKVTISVGIASSSGGECNTLDMLLNQADQALYVSKQEGRNQVNVFSAEKA
jgi:diguanylate cyclase (GGDEF)-like protein